jgi:hypothetical protein
MPVRIGDQSGLRRVRNQGLLALARARAPSRFHQPMRLFAYLLTDTLSFGPSC